MVKAEYWMLRKLRLFQLKMISRGYTQSSLSQIFVSFSLLDKVAGRLSLLHTDAYRGTTREQFGYRYAGTVWWFWNILDVIDGIFPLFPYLFIYRTEEAAGSSPARSTHTPPGMGVIALRCPQIGVVWLMRRVQVYIVCKYVHSWYKPSQLVDLGQNVINFFTT
jgi:hypothetical protein